MNLFSLPPGSKLAELGDFDLLDSFLFRRDNSQMATGVLKLCRVANSLDSSDFRSLQQQQLMEANEKKVEKTT